MLATHPETFEIMTKHNINLFHGTKFDALHNILNYGMNSIDELSKKGITISTGERWSRTNGKRDFISFTDDLDTALGYASIQNSQDKQNSSDFGILIGISSDDVKQMKTCSVHSEVPEIGVMNNVPLEYIKFIAKIKELMEEKEKAKTFDSESVKKLAEGRKKSGILDVYRKIKNKIKNLINNRDKNR